jgi:hypothetical protein
MANFGKRHRGAPLSGDVMRAFQKWVGKDGAVHVASELGVSDRTVRNWCKKSSVELDRLTPAARDRLKDIPNLGPEDFVQAFTELQRDQINAAERLQKPIIRPINGVPAHLANLASSAGACSNQKSSSLSQIADNGYRSGSAGPQDIITRALKLAEHGFPKAGFEMLIAEFHWGAKDFDRSMMLLPTLIYLGYRYIQPSHFISALRKYVLPQLVGAEGHPRCNPQIKSLCITQIVCALNERGGEPGRIAGELFDRADVRHLMQSCPDDLWPRQQMIRNEAVFWAHEAQPKRTLDLAREAEDLSRGVGDRRAVATIRCMAYFKSQNFARAWEFMESTYNQMRSILLDAAAGHWKDADNLWSAFSGVYTGSMAKSLSGTEYPTSELAEDLAAMRWAMTLYGHIQLEDPLLITPERHLPGELNQIKLRCLRISYDADQMDCLDRLIKVIDEL